MIGEASSWYLRSNELSAARIHKWLPEVKLIFVLRDPVQRAISDYWYNIQVGYLPPTVSLEAILEQDGPKHFLFQTGFYQDQLEGFLEYFPKPQICLLISENLQQDAANELKRICQFLEVADDFEFDPGRRHNTTLYPKNLKLYQRLHQWIPGLDQAMVNNPRLRPIRRRLFFSTTKSKPITPITTIQKLKQLFLPQIEALEHHWNLDLNHWK